jgi:hypothetical protein
MFFQEKCQIFLNTSNNHLFVVSAFISQEKPIQPNIYVSFIFVGWWSGSSKKTAVLQLNTYLNNVPI